MNEYIIQLADKDDQELDLIFILALRSFQATHTYTCTYTYKLIFYPLGLSS